MTRALARTFALLALTAAPAAARPLAYSLDGQTSQVGFTVDMGGVPLKGVMPVTRADLSLDFDHAANSKVRVTLNPAAARMGLPFAAETMRGPTVLDTGRYPDITFVSTRVRGAGSDAVIDGQITIRGVTRPIQLPARLFRPAGSASGTRHDLSIRLSGQISRAAFGASGNADLVDDLVRIDILAHIDTASIP
jgi:polyisoprenoid-binding protein YceI